MLVARILCRWYWAGNPNDFRAYMVQQVAAREYQLQLDGPLALARMAATRHRFPGE